jgi:hypothetical protein
MTGAAISELAWTAWPLRHRPRRGVLAGVLVVATVWGIWDLTRDPWLSSVSATILAVAVTPFFVPTGYRLSASGIEIHRPWSTRRLGWERYRGARANRNLVVLSPSRKTSWLDQVRGETLFFEGNRREVLEYVERMVGKVGATGSA